MIKLMSVWAVSRAYFEVAEPKKAALRKQWREPVTRQIDLYWELKDAIPAEMCEVLNERIDILGTKTLGEVGDQEVTPARWRFP